MTAPGWYHGQGDPAGTVRYWDGTTWVGEPTTDAANAGVVFYAAPAQDQLFGTVSPREQAVGAVSFKTTSTTTPVPAAVPVAPQPTPAIPTSAQFIAIGLSALKGLGLAFALLNFILTALFGTLAVAVTNNDNMADLVKLSLGIQFATMAIGFALVMTQALGAARNRPITLLLASLVMMAIDGLLTYAAWTNDQGASKYFYLGLLLLQSWVTIGALIGLVKRTP